MMIRTLNANVYFDRIRIELRGGQNVKSFEMNIVKIETAIVWRVLIFGKPSLPQKLCSRLCVTRSHKRCGNTKTRTSRSFHYANKYASSVLPWIACYFILHIRSGAIPSKQNTTQPTTEKNLVMKKEMGLFAAQHFSSAQSLWPILVSVFSRYSFVCSCDAIFEFIKIIFFIYCVVCAKYASQAKGTSENTNRK